MQRVKIPNTDRVNYYARKYKILLLVFIQEISDSIFISNNTPEIILIYRVKVVLTRNSGYFSNKEFGQRFVPLTFFLSYILAPSQKEGFDFYSFLDRYRS